MSATEEMEDLGPFGPGMSNFDHSVSPGFEDALRAAPGKVYGRHAAWDFNGRVWFDGAEFVEEVWHYGSPIATHKAETLEALMTKVNDEHGHE